MAGHGYYERSHNPHDGSDPWKTERSYNFEQPCDPALDGFEGRRKIAGDTYQYPEACVMKTETTIERIHPSMSSEFYKQCSPPRYENRPSYGVVNNKQHRPSIASNGWPPVVEEFPNKIQNDVSRPSGFSAPRPPYRLRIPVSAGHFGSNGSAEVSDHEKEWHKPVINTMKDKEPDFGDRKADKTLKPPATKEGVYGARPGHPTGSVPRSPHMLSEREQTIQPPCIIMAGHRERRGPDLLLSEPTNDIDTAVGYLKKIINPSSEEVPDGGRPIVDKNLKLPVAPESGRAIRPGYPTGSSLPNNYISSERGERTIQPPSITMAGGRERRGHDMGLEQMNETGKTRELPKKAAKPSSGSTVPKKDSIAETIDSKEAGRRYGNARSSPEPYSTGYTPTIDSRDAAKIYKGELV